MKIRLLLPTLLLVSTAFSEIDTSANQKTEEFSSKIEAKLTIKDGKNIFQSKNDWWDKYSGGIIAGLTVFTSLGISLWQSKATQKQTRSNSVAEARIQWIKELRPLMGELITKSSKLIDAFKEYKNHSDLNKKNNHPSFSEKEKQYDDAMGHSIYEFTNTYNQIKLFLNKQEVEHADFIKCVDERIEYQIRVLFEEKDKLDNFDPNLGEEDLIQKAQIILKTAWEQAKHN